MRPMLLAKLLAKMLLARAAQARIPRQVSWDRSDSDRSGTDRYRSGTSAGGRLWHCMFLGIGAVRSTARTILFSQHQAAFTDTAYKNERIAFMAPADLPA